MALGYVILGSGRDLELAALHLTSTYGTFLEGHPVARINDRIVANLAGWATDVFPHGPVHVITPGRTELATEPGGHYPFGPPQLLPAVPCIARFSSHPIDPDADAVMSRSRLTVVWLQAEAAVPTGEVGALRELPWDELAEDVEI